MARKPAERKARVFVDEVPGAEPATPAGDEKAERLSFPLAADGSAAVEQLRPATREKLRQAFSSPTARAAIFGGSVPAGPSAQDLAICSALYDTISSVLVSVYRASGFTLEQASLARYTDEQKEAMVPLTAKVLSKWVGDFAYMDELMLGVMLITITSQNINAVQNARTARVVPMSAAADNPA